MESSNGFASETFANELVQVYGHCHVFTVYSKYIVWRASDRTLKK